MRQVIDNLTYLPNGDNFLRWSHGVQLYIHGQGKIGYLTRDKKTPAKVDPLFATWDTENSVVMTWNYVCYSTRRTHCKKIWNSWLFFNPSGDDDLGDKASPYTIICESWDLIFPHAYMHDIEDRNKASPYTTICGTGDSIFSHAYINGVELGWEPNPYFRLMWVLAIRIRVGLGLYVFFFFFSRFTF